MTNPLVTLQTLGQSPWLDNIQRGLLTSGALRQMVKAGDITGLTSNPTIFEQAIAHSPDYDAAIEKLAPAGQSAEAIYESLALADIRAAAAVFAPVYRRTGGADGYVSIEVSPRLAHATQATVTEARRLWKAVGAPNLMIKIPATPEGVPAIEQCLAEGINVNATLIFSLQRYDEVLEAYLAGLQRRVAAGKSVRALASVASFFVSRVDTLVDKILDEKIDATGLEVLARLERLKGRAAIANAKLAYAAFKQKFASERFQALARRGARVQRPLWASTSTKNPAYADVYYIEALIGSQTVNTMPPATLAAYKDHGQPAARLEEAVDQAAAALTQLEEVGVSLAAVTRKLEEAGVASFAQSYEALLQTVESRCASRLLLKRQKLALGKHQAAVQTTLAEMEKARLGERLWQKDASLWKPDDPAHQSEIKIRLGWVDVVNLMQTKVAELTACANEIRRSGFTHAVLCGMGGSSLAPEVLRATFGVAAGYLDLAVLDSTDPAAVISAETRGDLAHTFFIIASKSGGTTEPNAMFKFFWERVKAVKGKRTGQHFIAITDPGTAMERTAKEHGFRRIFLNPPEIGGRYSALSYFGLVPAALIGMDVARLLERARFMMSACGPHLRPAQNPALVLGAALGVLARAGRDKVTFVTADKICAFNYWVEQLVAESTGKEGKGILPVEGEHLGRPAVYGSDRAFVHLRLSAKYDLPLAMLARAGHPLIEVRLADAYDLGAEFFRWELATAAAGWVLGIDPFDQPNVQEAKDNTKALLAEQAASGRLPEPGGMLAVTAATFAAQLRQHLKTVKRGDYVALTAYLESTPAVDKLLRALQTAIRDRYHVATTLGYGPRFLHSTGQLHKGGANNGVFIQFSGEDPIDAPIAGEVYTFSILKTAQALGDYQALVGRGRRVLRVNLGEEVEAGLRAALECVTRKTPKRSARRKKSKRA